MRCPACDADTYYDEHGVAWIGGFGAGLVLTWTGRIIGEANEAKIEDLCQKHRASLCSFLEQINSLTGSKLQIVGRGDGWYLVNEASS